MCVRPQQCIRNSTFQVIVPILDFLTCDGHLCTPLLGLPVNTGRVCMVALRWQSLKHTKEVCGFNSHALFGPGTGHLLG